MPNPEQILLNGRQLGWMRARPLVGNEDVESFFRQLLRALWQGNEGEDRMVDPKGQLKLSTILGRLCPLEG